MANIGAWGVDSSFGDSCLRLLAVRELMLKLARDDREGKASLSRNLSAEMKRSPATLGRQLENLSEEGLIEIEGGHNAVKLVSLTEEGRAMAQRCGAPVLGLVPAGVTRCVTECDGRDQEGAQMYRNTWDDVLPLNEKFGILEVKGDSMIGEHIMPGDQVQLRLKVQLHHIEPGQICAVMVGDEYESTLKYVFPDEDSEMVTLRAANERYKDIRVHRDELRIVGALFGLVRTYEGRK